MHQRNKLQRWLRRGREYLRAGGQRGRRPDHGPLSADAYELLHRVERGLVPDRAPPRPRPVARRPTTTSTLLGEISSLAPFSSGFDTARRALGARRAAARSAGDDADKTDASEVGGSAAGRQKD